MRQRYRCFRTLANEGATLQLPQEASAQEGGLRRRARHRRRFTRATQRTNGLWQKQDTGCRPCRGAGSERRRHRQLQLQRSPRPRWPHRLQLHRSSLHPGRQRDGGTDLVKNTVLYIHICKKYYHTYHTGHQHTIRKRYMHQQARTPKATPKSISVDRNRPLSTLIDRLSPRCVHLSLANEKSAFGQAGTDSKRFQAYPCTMAKRAKA